METKYTTADMARTLSVSERTIRRKLEKLFKIESGRYEVSQEIFDLVKKEFKTADNLRTTSGQSADNKNEDFAHTEYFTESEYQEFHKRLTEYPLLKEQLENSQEYLDILKNELEYHKKAYLRQLDIHEKMLGLTHQRNFIEAKEKGIEKD